VRNPAELDHGHVAGAHNVPLIEIQKKSMDGTVGSAIPRDIPVYIHCKGGARSIMACSILRKLGYTNQVNINGGFDSIKKDNTKVRIVE
jgi:hydroxyacylglutathione hydrolase